MDGQPNPAYPREAQPRNLATPGSRSLVNEAAAHYRVAEALDQSESAAIGPAIVTPKQVTMVGNRRLQMLARVYDRHPENAAAYRAGLIARGYDPEGMKFPVLVRELREDLTPTEMQFVGREGNVSPTGKMAAGEQAFSDASLLGDELLALHRSGPVTSLANVPFVRSFVDRLVATTEREAFISKDNVLSVEGVRRVEAALVAKAYEAPDIVAGLFEVTDPSSRAILGALADNAGKAAHVKAEIAAGRIDAELDPSPALVEAFRLVERARKSGQKVDMLAAQVDLETGAVSPATLDALDYYFRDPPKSKAAKEAGVAYRVAAGRVAIAPQIERAMITSLSKADAAGDLLGFKADAGFALREGGTAEMPPGDLPAGEDLAAPAAEGAAAPVAAEAAPAAEPVLALDEAATNTPELFQEEAMKGGAAPAEGLPAELQAIVERNKPEIAGPESLRALLERGGTTDELFAHPDVDEALRVAAGMSETAPWVEFRADPYEGAPAGFYENRVYKFPILAKDGKTVTGWREVVGRKAAVAELVKVAKAYAPDGKVAIERRAVILTGPPAAGKSTFAEEIATRLRAAIVDSDDAKKPIPGFKGGAGAEATHAESANLTWAARSVYDDLSAEGANLVIPKIGKTAGQIEELVADLRKLGYDDVRLVNVNVHPDEAARRMIGRFLKTGRIIGGKYFRSIGDGPSKTYYILRGEKPGGKPLVDEAVEIDANGGLQDPRKLIDGADTELGRELLAAGPGGGRESGAPRLAGRAGGPGEEVPGPQSARGAESGAGRGPGARGSLPEGAPDAGAGVKPPKPIGDPQLAAEADSVIADVGEDFQIYLAEPGSDEVRTLSIAQARAEAAEVDAAANELLACIAGAAGVTAAAGGAAAGAAAL